MKKLFLFLLMTLCVLFVSCDSGGGGGGDDDHSPMIANVRILADPGDLIETTTFSVGDIFYVSFEAYDEDKDIKSAFGTVTNTTTSTVTCPETEMALPKQTELGMIYFIPFQTVSEDVGTSRLYLYIKDKAGNMSNPITKTVTVN